MISRGVRTGLKGKALKTQWLRWTTDRPREGQCRCVYGVWSRAVPAGWADCRGGWWVCLEHVSWVFISHGLKSLLPKDKYWQQAHVICNHCHCSLLESTKQQHEEDSERENRSLTRSPEEWWEFMLCLPGCRGRCGEGSIGFFFVQLLICPLLLIQHEKHRGSDIIK